MAIKMIVIPIIEIRLFVDKYLSLRLLAQGHLIIEEYIRRRILSSGGLRREILTIWYQKLMLKR